MPLVSQSQLSQLHPHSAPCATPTSTKTSTQNQYGFRQWKVAESVAKAGNYSSSTTFIEISSKTGIAILVFSSVMLWKAVLYFCKADRCLKIVISQDLSVFNIWSVIFLQTLVKVVFPVSTHGLIAWLAPSDSKWQERPNSKRRK